MPLTHARGAGWFPVAVQALVYLARSDVACSSSAMAPDLNAHAVFLRRVLAQLGRANLIEAREGRDGGYRLARPPEQITAAESTDQVIASGAVLSPVESVLDELEAEAERRRLEVLARVSLADILQRAGGAAHLS